MTKIFRQNGAGKEGQVLKMSTSEPNQYKSKISDQTQEQDQEKESQAVLSVFSKRVQLNSSIKDSFNTLLHEESPYDEILSELDTGRVEIKKKGEKYRRKNGFLVIHQDKQNEDVQYWRVIVPDNFESRNLIISELHCIPFSAHPGVHRTLAKVQQYFYWKGMTSHIREYVESCQVCQTEKSDHTLSKGKLQSVQLPQEKWQEISLDFITDLPLTRNRKDSILTVVDKATRMVHLIPCKKDVTASDTAQLVWQNIVKLHGIPRVIFSDRGT